jgi:hypothetical protein
MLQPKTAYRFLLIVLFAAFTFTACNNKGEKKKESTEKKMDTADTKPTKDGD